VAAEAVNENGLLGKINRIERIKVFEEEVGRAQWQRECFGV
jgi:hypothetical protein